MVRPQLRAAAYALCVADDHLLMARFVGRTRREWTLPGGGLEHGESPYDAVIREVAEETGYRVEVERLLGVHTVVRNIRYGRRGVVNLHTVVILYAARVVGGALTHEVGGSTDMAAWVPLVDLADPTLDKSEIVDVALALDRTRPLTGHP
jgi:ADP-ribose pyrophosphatase YjhB (NUDIX family)